MQFYRAFRYSTSDSNASLDNNFIKMGKNEHSFVWSKQSKRTTSYAYTYTREQQESAVCGITISSWMRLRMNYEHHLQNLNTAANSRVPVFFRAKEGCRKYLHLNPLTREDAFTLWDIRLLDKEKALIVQEFHFKSRPLWINYKHVLIKLIYVLFCASVKRVLVISVKKQNLRYLLPLAKKSLFKLFVRVKLV